MSTYTLYFLSWYMLGCLLLFFVYWFLFQNKTTSSFTQNPPPLLLELHLGEASQHGAAADQRVDARVRQVQGLLEPTAAEGSVKEKTGGQRKGLEMCSHFNRRP